MDDAKIKELQALHHELATYLGQQNELIITLRRTVATLQQTLDNDSSPRCARSALSERYKAFVAAQGTSEMLQPNLTERLSQQAVNSLAKRLNEW